MINKKQKILISLATVNSVLLAGVLISNNSKNIKQTFADPCTHEHVERYAGSINGTTGSVEHWACCDCHTAWADANKTIPIGNTIQDRSKIDLDIGVRYDVDWGGGTCEPCYDENRGYYFKNYITNLEKDAYTAIETSNSPFKLDGSESLGSFGLITNKTSAVLRVDIHSRAWGSRVYQEYLGIGETKEFFVDIDTWNAEQSGSDYGYAILCYNTDAQEAGGYIEVTRPEYEFPLKKFVDHMEGADWHWHQTCYDPIYGAKLKVELTGETNRDVRFSDRVLVDESLYDGVLVDVYNDSDKDSGAGNIWSEAWGDHSCHHDSFKKGQWSTIYIPNYVWNANHSVVTIYDLGLDTGYLYFANFRFSNMYYKGDVVFGSQSGEDITIENSGWSNAIRTEAEMDGKILKAFSIDYPGSQSIATNNGKTIDPMSYSNVYFFVYNGTSSTISMNSTPDWNHYQYYTLEPGKWTKCSIPVDEWNIAKTHYFYPTAEAGNIIISYFYGEEIAELDGFATQYVDLNIGVDGSIDTEKSFSLDLINDSRIQSVDLVKYNNVTISTSEKVNVSNFGNIFGNTTLEVKVTTTEGPRIVKYPVLLCSKLISTKQDLDNFPLIAGALGDPSKLIYNGYFALANDITYNGNWTSFITKNGIYGYDGGKHICDPNIGFIGTFDGCGHIIDGLHVYPTTDDWNGNSFIYKLGQSGIIKNVGFLNARLTAAGGYVASLGEGTIKDVYVKYSSDLDYSDGLATFFYNDRANEGETVDLSYVGSLPMNIINCYVDALNIYLGKTNTHVIGSKKLGYVNLQNVFAEVDNSLINNATLTKTGEIGSFTLEDLSKNKAVINDLNNCFTASIFNHEDVVLPNVYTGTENIDNFIKDGKTDYAIYAGENLSTDDLDAVNILTSKIKEIAGVRMYVSLNENLTSNTCLISLEKNTNLNGNYQIKIDDAKNIKLSYVDSASLKKECLELLNLLFGYKNFNFEFEYAPKVTGTVNLKTQDVTYNSFNGESVSYSSVSDERQILNGYTPINNTFVNVKSNYDASMSGQYHNMFFYLPPEMYYSSHPSWYTPNMQSYGGYFNPKSGLHDSNLCFSANGNAAELATMKDEFYSRLKTNLLANPTLNDICVGQNDNAHERGDFYCTCDACKALINENIAILSFLNDMSQRVKTDPDFAGRDIYLYTMAYRDSIIPPSTSDIILDDHVGVWIAPIECNYAYAMNDQVNNAETYADIEGWKALTNNISFYLYSSNFMRPLAPLFSFESMVENIKYMKSFNPKYIFYCDVYGNTSKTGFGAFTDYIISRLSVNCDLTYEQLKAEFFGVNGYYGEAGPKVIYYFDELVKAMNENKSDYGNVYNAYVINKLSEHLGSMAYWYEYSFCQALDDLDPTNPYYEVYKKNVETEALFLRYMKYVGGKTWYSGDSKTQFIEDCKSHGINYIQEGVEINSTTLDKQKI